MLAGWMIIIIAVGLSLDPFPSKPYNGSVTCQTRENALLRRHETLCSDGLVVHSRWNALLSRWESQVIQQPRQPPQPAPRKR